MTAYKLTIHTLGTTDIAFTRVYETLEEACKILNQFKKAGITGTIMDCMTFQLVEAQTCIVRQAWLNSGLSNNASINQ